MPSRVITRSFQHVSNHCESGASLVQRCFVSLRSLWKLSKGGDNDRVDKWKNGRSRSTGFTVCWKHASSSVLSTAPTWKASRELCLEALPELLRVYSLTSSLRIYATDHRACRTCKERRCLTIYLFCKSI